MYLYRGKEIGDWKKLTATCLNIIKSGSAEEISEIIPHIRILRDDSFYAPLEKHLQNGEVELKIAAALALGSLGKERCIGLLRESYLECCSERTSDNAALESALISALGEISSSRSVEVLTEILAGDGILDRATQRSQLAIEALGQLAQQGIPEAEQELRILLQKCGIQLQGQVIAELSLAYWHRPGEISDELLDLFCQLAATRTDEVRTTARAALTSLSQLGNSKARDFLFRLSQTQV